MTKKRAFSAALPISIILILTAAVIWHCSAKNPDEVRLHPDISRMMGYLNVDKCRITELSGLNEIGKIDVSDSSVSQKEIDDYVADQLDMNRSFRADPSAKQIKENDCVNFSLVKYEGDEEIFSGDDEYLCIDENDQSVVTRSLTGHIKGDTYEVHENVEGHDYRYEITIKRIGKMVAPELNDEVVREYFNADSVSDYLASLRDSLNNENRSAAILGAQDDILEELIDKCKFDMDKQQVTDYSVSVVNSYVDEAYLYNKDLKTYYTEDLHMSEKQFFDSCYKQGEDYIKKMLVVGALAEQDKCSIDEKEVLEAFDLSKRPDDEAYTYMEYQLLTSAVTAPYIIKDDE